MRDLAVIAQVQEAAERRQVHEEEPDDDSDDGHDSILPEPADQVTVSVDPRTVVAVARRRLEEDRFVRRPQDVILSAEEEVGLARLLRPADHPLAEPLPVRYRATLDPGGEHARAFDAMVLHNQRLVSSIALQYLGRGLAKEDLFQSGFLGLFRAIELFDATQGTKFSTYATWWIRQSVTRAIANEGALIRLPVHVYED
nr:sigma-70 family RNA polymerase sigma factor [Micromonospora sp. DSM 115978]